VSLIEKNFSEVSVMKQMRIDRIAVGQYIRKLRIAKKMRQEDLADYMLSQSAVSNIERGSGEVSEEKINHLLAKLKSDKTLDDFYTPVLEDEEALLNEELHINLISIENTIDLVCPKEGLNQLKNLHIPDRHDFAVIVEFLRAKGYFHKSQLNKAHKYYFNCIHMLEHRYSHMKFTNLKSACYHELSTIEYKQNNFEQAVNYSTKAEECFLPYGERQYYREMIPISRAVYLEKLNRIGEALLVLNQMHSSKLETPSENQKCEINSFECKEAILNYYEMQAKLLAKNNHFSEAVNYALKGIELARIDKMFARSLELWTTLGSIFMSQDKLNLAECCFTMAKKLTRKVQKDYLLSYIYKQLGMLYYKGEEIDLAKKEFVEGLRYSKRANDISLQIEALIGIVQCYIKQDNREKVLEFSQEALALATRHAFCRQKTRLYFILTIYLRDINDPDFSQYLQQFFLAYCEFFQGGEEMSPFQDLMIAKQHLDGEPPNG
jgi:transcriptional regulator with XRE-family HTH domain